MRISKETKDLLKFISDTWPNLDIYTVKLILYEAKEVLTMEYAVSVIGDAEGKERTDMVVLVKDLKLN